MVHYAVSIVVALFFAIVGTALALRFKLPAVLGLLVAGMLLGPSVLGVINYGENFELMQLMGEVGAILLLFTLGIEFSLLKLIQLGFRILLIFLFKIAFIFFLAYEITLLLGFDLLTALYIGVILSITSTAIFAKILEQQGLFSRSEVPMLIGVLILEDLYAIVALTFFSGLNKAEQFSRTTIFFKFFAAILLLLAAYLIGSKILKLILDWLTKYPTEESFAFLSISLCFGMAVLANSIGLAPTVGAFIAGSIIANQKQSEKLEKAIRPFMLVFVALFFLSIGLLVNLLNIWTSLGVVIALLFVNIFAKFLGTALPAYFFAGMDSRSAMFSGVAMVSLGEFSLLIAKESAAANLSIDLVSITTGIIFGSVIIMSLTLKNSDSISNKLKGLFSNKVVEELRYISYRITNAIDQLDSKGKIHEVVIQKRAILFRDCVIIALLGGLFFSSIIYLRPLVINSLFYGEFLIRLFWGAMSILIIAAILIFLKHFKDILDLFTESFLKEEETAAQKNLETKGFKNILIAILLAFMGLFLFPILIRYLRLPSPYYFISAIVLFFSILFFWVSMKTIGKVIVLRRNELFKLKNVGKRMKKLRQKWYNDILAESVEVKK